MNTESFTLVISVVESDVFCCRVLQCVAVQYTACCSADYCSVLQRVAACCSVLQRVAACCSVW